MKTPSLLGIALLCLSASVMAAGMDNGTVSVEVQQNWSFPKACHVRNYRNWYRVGHYCLKYFPTPLSFPNAEFACRQKAPGGHLVSVHNECTNIAVHAIATKHGSTKWTVWLGGMQLFKSQRFIWTDGSLWNFQNWAPGEPNNLHKNEDCVEMYSIQSHGKWNDLHCGTKMPFICAFQWAGRQELED